MKQRQHSKPARRREWTRPPGVADAGAIEKSSASSRATARVRRGEPLAVDGPADRSPKQENL
jgi:hypothetical protein